MPRRVMVLAAALAVALAGCSAFDAKPSVSVKALSADLAFGGKAEREVIPAPTPTPVATPAPPPVPVPVFVPPPSLPPLPGSIPGSRRPCEPESPFPKRPAPPSIEERPELGEYPFAYVHTSGGRSRRSAGGRVVTDLRLEMRAVEIIGFSYSVDDERTGVRMRLMVQTAEPGRGLYLQEIRFAGRGGNLLVRPQPPVQLLGFPLQPRVATTGRGIDALAGVVESETRVLDREPGRDRIRACDEVLDAWRATWTLTVRSPLRSQQMRGAFWFATQMGGWPIAERATFSGDVLTGAVAATITRAVPSSLPRE